MINEFGEAEDVHIRFGRSVDCINLEYVSREDGVTATAGTRKFLLKVIHRSHPASWHLI